MTLSTIFSVVAFHEMLEDAILYISILKTELSHLTLFNIVDMYVMHVLWIVIYYFRIKLYDHVKLCFSSSG